jgi:hypothetical protein
MPTKRVSCLRFMSSNLRPWELIELLCSLCRFQFVQLLMQRFIAWKEWMNRWHFQEQHVFLHWRNPRIASFSEVILKEDFAISFLSHYSTLSSFQPIIFML